MNRYLIVFIVSIFVCIVACKEDLIEPEPLLFERVELFNLAQVPFQNLSQYGFYKGEMAELNPHRALLPYELPTGLFSNYAIKQRLIYFPLTGKAEYIDDEQLPLNFPEGTIIVKTFYYQNDFRDEALGKNIIETRLLVRRNNDWEAYDYVWNEEQTEATKQIAGKQVTVDWIHYDGSARSTLYAIPNENECKGCHELGDEMVLIGPKARYLNSKIDFGLGLENQIEKWMEYDLIDGVPAINEIPSVAAFDDVTASIESRARAYLDINCAHCHNADGPANNTGMFLNYLQTDSIKLGVCKPPTAAGQGSGGLAHSIEPGLPEESIMIYRLNSLELDVSMPELGRSVIHEEGLALLTDWIAQLEGDCN